MPISRSHRYVCLRRLTFWDFSIDPPGHFIVQEQLDQDDSAASSEDVDAALLVMMKKEEYIAK
jgi:hypothetical protein